MSFWETNRGLLLAVGGALAFALIVHFVIVGPVRGEAGDLNAQADELQTKIDALNPASGKPASGAVAEVKTERGRLDAALGKVGGLLLEMPKAYAVTAGKDPVLSFENQLNAVRNRCAASGRYTKASTTFCPLGITSELQKKEELPVLRERLYAVDRLTAAADDAGIARVLSIVHGQIGSLSAPGVSRMHLELLPMTMRAQTDEKGLIAFVERISRRGEFLALQSLEVEVTDPKARTFNVTAVVLALAPREGPGGKKSGGRYGGTGQGGTSGPSTPIGRY